MRAQVFAVLVLAGCQTQTTSNISVKDAKEVVADFEEITSTPPPRSIISVLKNWEDNLFKGWQGKLARIHEIAGINGSCHQDPSLTYKEVLKTASGLRQKTLSRTLQHNAYNHFLNGHVPRMRQFAKGAMLHTPGNWAADIGYTKADIAFYEASVGNLPDAKSAIGGAYGMERKQGSWQTYGRFRQLRGEGAVARLSGDEDEALGYYLNAVKTSRESSYEGRNWKLKEYGADQVIGVIAEIVDMYRIRGELKEAESIALHELKRNSSGYFFEKPETSILITRFAQVLYDLGRYDEALAAAELSMRLFDFKCVPADSFFYTRSLMVLGKIRVAKEDYAGGLKIFNKIRSRLENLPELQQININKDISTGIAYLLTSDGEKSRSIFKLAQKYLAESPNKNAYAEAEAAAFISLSEYKLGNTKLAFQGLKKSLPLLLSNSWERDADDTAFTARDKRLAIIIDMYLEMLVLQKTVARANGIDPVGESFLITQAVRGKRMERTFAASMARSKVGDSELAKLVRGEQDLGKRLHQLQTQLIAALSDTENKYQKKQIAAVKEQISLVISAKRALRKEIVTRFPEYIELINPSPLKVVDVQKSLGVDEALIVTYTSKSRTFIWAIPKQGDIIFAEAKLSHQELANAVSDIRIALEPRATTLGDIPPFDVAASHDLYNRILKPVEAGWKSAKSLYVTSHGPLGALPFSLLVTKPIQLEPDQNLLFAENRTVPWLARSHAIVMLPSVSSLKSLGTAKPKLIATLPFIGFADPYFSEEQALAALNDDTVQLASITNTRGIPLKLRSKPLTRAVDSASLAQLPRLPGTRWEIESIAKTLGVNPDKVTYTGKMANEQKVKTLDLTPYRVISFATHGLVPGDLDGLYQPALALTAPGVANIEGDGLLTVDEILGLKLNADWAVLSACNTAAADGAGSEAVSGLGRAFFYAGARSLLVSNWSVHSDSTVHLMTKLFDLQAKDRTLARSTALQKTRLQMIDHGIQKNSQGNSVFSYAHPIFWAPFTIVGDGGGAKVGS